MNRVSRSRSLHLPGAAALLIAIFTSSVRANDDSLYVDMAIAKKSTSGKTVPVKDACDIKLNFDAYSAGTVCYAVYLIDVAWAKVDTKATGALVQNPTNVGDEHTQNAGANRRSCHQKSGHYTSASNHSLST